MRSALEHALELCAPSCCGWLPIVVVLHWVGLNLNVLHDYNSYSTNLAASCLPYYKTSIDGTQHTVHHVCLVLQARQLERNVLVHRGFGPKNALNQCQKEARADQQSAFINVK